MRPKVTVKLLPSSSMFQNLYDLSSANLKVRMTHSVTLRILESENDAIARPARSQEAALATACWTDYDLTRDAEQTRMIDVNALIGTHDVLFVTLDTLRYDVAQECVRAGRTPNLARVLPGGTWEPRHSPGNFTLAAHQAFFAGFLPTPTTPGKHPRLFALRFPGSETTVPETCVFDAPDIVTGFAQRGYHTACIGGVGFFNELTPLGNVLPGLFAESEWSPTFGVTEPRSTHNQVTKALNVLESLPSGRRIFLFINISAIHQP